MSRTIFRSLIALLALALMAAVPMTAAAKRHAHHKSSHARKADRNRDGLPNRWERKNHLSLKVNQAPRDQDRDGANNAAEFAAHTDPHRSDSDDDGVKDGSENAGTVVSFKDGVLVISSGGLPISGKVTADTEIKCGVCGRDGHGDDHGDDHEDGPGAHASHDGWGGHGDDDGTVGGLPEPSHGGLPGDDRSHGGLPGGSNGGLPPFPGMPRPRCSTDDLKPGAIVREAELKLTAAGAVWDEIKLVPVTPAPPAPAAG